MGCHSPNDCCRRCPLEGVSRRARPPFTTRRSFNSQLDLAAVTPQQSTHLHHNNNTDDKKMGAAESKPVVDDVKKSVKKSADKVAAQANKSADKASKASSVRRRGRAGERHGLCVGLMPQSCSTLALLGRARLDTTRAHERRTLVHQQPVLKAAMRAQQRAFLRCRRRRPLIAPRTPQQHHKKNRPSTRPATRRPRPSTRPATR